MIEFCNKFDILKIFFKYLSDYKPTVLDLSILPDVFYQTAVSMSQKNISHYLQNIIFIDGNMRKFNYGTKKNQEIYHNDKPPIYDLGVWGNKTKKPIIIYYGQYDRLSTKEDNLNLVEKNKKGNICHFEIPEYGHLSFI